MRAKAKMKTLNAKLNKRERRAQQLLAHYATCERLARYLGVSNPDGKKISVALWKAEKLGSRRAVGLCNEESYCRSVQPELDWRAVITFVEKALGKLPPGFFVNGDPRGYALKIDNENPAGRALIEAVKLHTDMGGYGILSPEIDGD